jgi:hypothetical protein
VGNNNNSYCFYKNNDITVICERERFNFFISYQVKKTEVLDVPILDIPSVFDENIN